MQKNLNCICVSHEKLSVTFEKKKNYIEENGQNKDFWKENCL